MDVSVVGKPVHIKNNMVVANNDQILHADKLHARYQSKLLANYGILNVTKAPYLADPCGRKDSTSAESGYPQTILEAKRI